MSIYKLESIHAMCVEDLPKEISYHYKYQTQISKLDKKGKTIIPFPLKSSKDLEGKHLVNMYNFPPSRMKTIYSKNLFNLPTHTRSRLVFLAGVELHFDEKGKHFQYRNGTLYFYHDNFGYAILRNGFKNCFYAFGCFKHEFENLSQEQCKEYGIQETIRYMFAVQRCKKCGFYETLDSSD